MKKGEIYEGIIEKVDFQTKVMSRWMIRKS